MDFELKTLNRALVCSEKADALMVLVPEGFAAEDDALSVLATLAIKSGDLETKPGKLLNAYRVPGIEAPRVVLVGAGDASEKSIRTAANAAMGALKTSNAQRAVLCLGLLASVQPEAVRAAVVACAEASYAYTTTKSKPAAV